MLEGSLLLKAHKLSEHLFQEILLLAALYACTRHVEYHSWCFQVSGWEVPSLLCMVACAVFNSSIVFVNYELPTETTIVGCFVSCVRRQTWDLLGQG